MQPRHLQSLSAISFWSPFAVTVGFMQLLSRELVVCHYSVHDHVDHWLPLELPFRFEKKRRQPKKNFQCGVDEAVFNLTGKFSVLLVSVLERFAGHQF
jgi:hypothetical protein